MTEITYSTPEWPIFSEGPLHAVTGDNRFGRIGRKASHMEMGISHVRWLDGKARSVYSQFGEDGFHEAIFDRIGEGSRWCLEVGAGDGVTFSGTKAFRDKGWCATLIESDWETYKRLEANCPGDEEFCFHERADPESFAPLCSTDRATLDLAIIDIDGLDYWLWQDTPNFRPRVVCIEYGGGEVIGTFDDPNFIPPVGGAGQAGRSAMIELGERLGYVLVAETFCNLIWVAEEEL